MVSGADCAVAAAAATTTTTTATKTTKYKTNTTKNQQQQHADVVSSIALMVELGTLTKTERERGLVSWGRLLGC